MVSTPEDGFLKSRTPSSGIEGEGQVLGSRPRFQWVPAALPLHRRLSSPSQLLLYLGSGIPEARWPSWAVLEDAKLLKC